MCDTSLSWESVAFLLPLAVASFVEHTDSGYFYGIVRALEIDPVYGGLGVTMGEVGALRVADSLGLILSKPIWGGLVDGGLLSPEAMMIIGTTGWGLASLASALLVASVPQFLLVRFLNGVSIASLYPAMGALVERTQPEEVRGRCFALLVAAGSAGSILAAQVSTSISELEVARGFLGWRLGLLVVAMASFVLALFLAKQAPYFAALQEAERRRRGLWGAKGRELAPCRGLQEILRVCAFWPMVLQGVFGRFANITILNLVLWGQYHGLSDVQAGNVGATWQLGRMLGSMASGVAADLLESRLRWPRHIVPVVACWSNALFLFLLFFILPHNPVPFLPLLLLILAFGINSMGFVGVNGPLLLRMSPRPDMVGSTLGWMGSMEETPAIFMGFIVQKWLLPHAGYRQQIKSLRDMDPAERAANAEALTLVLGGCSCPAWFLSGLCYTTLFLPCCARDIPIPEPDLGDPRKSMGEEEEEEDRLQANSEAEGDLSPALPVKPEPQVYGESAQ